MKTIPLSALSTLLHGHLGVVDQPTGVQPVRFDSSMGFMLDPLNSLTASMTSGVRLRLKTNSTTLKLVTSQTQLFLTGPEQWARNFEVYVDGTIVRQVAAHGGSFLTPGAIPEGDPHAILTIDGLGDAVKDVEIWFPQSSLQVINSLEVDSEAAWEPWADDRRHVLFHGSSITHGMEANGGSGAWPAVAGQLADIRITNMGWAGSCLLSALAAQIIAQQSIDAVVLELGINIWDGGALNQRTLNDSAHGVISILRDSYPSLPIVIVSPICSPAREQVGENGGLSLEQIREGLKAAVDAHISKGDNNISYQDGLALFGPADAELLVDGLHPSAEGYQLIGERFYHHHRDFLSGDSQLLAGN
ncbi:hypothetical protein TCK1_3360 [Pseudomonas monteilii]|uniref:SGNH hydrolase-type esterase domain-containing protein n=1 Tax=Pseudomonas monteilii TaxID=76759 RepID=A0AAE6RCX9_9PSED|nr:SGNH/GDSL hydrolase family protein [Pseudomonas monteilii]QHB28706.1 hypothetical protein TCK1_3360 [Pseudomonas monteilii]